MAARSSRHPIPARHIPGIGRAATTDLPVLKPLTRPIAGPTATQWLASLPWWTALVLMAPVLLWPVYVQAAGKFTVITAFGTLGNVVGSAPMAAAAEAFGSFQSFMNDTLGWLVSSAVRAAPARPASRNTAANIVPVSPANPG